MLTHTTAWDRFYGGDTILKIVLIYVARLYLARLLSDKAFGTDHTVLKSSIRNLASPHVAAVGLGFWNFDNVVLKLSICSSASPRMAAV